MNLAIIIGRMDHNAQDKVFVLKKVENSWIKPKRITLKSV